MNKLGKILTVLVIALFVGVIIMRILPKNTDGHIADVNGADNYALNTIIDADITAMAGNSTGIGVHNSSSSDATVCYSERFSGVELLHEAEVVTPVTFVITNASVTAGNLRIVLVQDNTVIHDFALTGAEQVCEVTTPGAVSLRIAGESAGFTFGFEVR